MSCPRRLSALGAPQPQRVCDQIDRIFKNFDDLNQLIRRVGSQIRRLEAKESDLQRRISELRVASPDLRSGYAASDARSARSVGDCPLVEQARDRMKQMQQELDATRAQLAQLRSRQDGYATLEKVLGTIDANLSSLAGQVPSRPRPESGQVSKMDAPNFPAVLPPAPNPMAGQWTDPPKGEYQSELSGVDKMGRRRFNGKLLPETKYPAGRTPRGLSSKEDKLVSQQIEKAKRDYLRKVKEAQKLEEQRNKWIEWQTRNTPNKEQKAIIARADKLYRDKLYEVEKANAQIEQMEAWQAAGSVPKNLKVDIARKTAPALRASLTPQRGLRVPKPILKTDANKKRVRFLDTLGSLPAPPRPNFGQ